MAGAACTAVRAAEVGSALERERGRAVVGAADAMPCACLCACSSAKVSAPVRYVGVLGVVPSTVLVPQARVCVH